MLSLSLYLSGSSLCQVTACGTPRPAAPPHFLAVVSLAVAWDRRASWACGPGSRAAGVGSR
eukprot:14730737-Heterocapsa_arctica.AAC.1